MESYSKRETVFAERIYLTQNRLSNSPKSLSF